MKRLIRFWFRFEQFAGPEALNLGCGMTAYDYNDALGLLREKVFKKNVFPRILEFNEDVDISSLDQRHIVPNMEDPTLRGIWFPRGCRS